MSDRSRQESGRRYSYALAAARSTDWRSLHERYLVQELSPEEELVLVHPMWYSHLEVQGSHTSVRGKRVFPPAPVSGACQSVMLWGYVCPFDAHAIHVDHLFPYSLGGPTIAENARYLCAFHNSAKGHDFHNLDLGATTRSWRDRQIGRIAALLA